MTVPSSTTERVSKGDYLRERIAPNLFEYEHTATGNLRWVLEWSENDRRKEQVIKGVRNRSEAKKEALRLNGLRASGEMVAAPTRMTMADLWVEFDQHRLSLVAAGASRRAHVTRQGQWANWLQPVIGTVRINDLDKHDLGRVSAKVRKAKKSGSLEDQLLDLTSAMMQYGIERDYAKVNPVRQLPKSMKPTVRNAREVYAPTPEETEKLIASASEGWRLLFLYLAETGTRISEALGASWGDLDTDACTIRVERQLDRGPNPRLIPLKTQRSKRTIPMSQRLRKELLAGKMRSSRKGDDDFMFTTGTGNPLAYANASRAFASAVKKSKVDPGKRRLSPHSLRHSWGSRLLVAGLPVESVSRMLGHSSPVMTLTVYSNTLAHLTASGELASRFEAAMGGAR